MWDLGQADEDRLGALASLARFAALAHTLETVFQTVLCLTEAALGSSGNH